MTTYPNFKFEVLHNDTRSSARVARLTTPHGAIETPNFIFCGTHAALRNMRATEAKAMGADIILSNTYHLLVRPGPETVEKLGGVHKMTGWTGPMMTDSGGYQIFAMKHGGVADEIKGRRKEAVKRTLLKVSEEGAKFLAYNDGRHILLTPELSMRMQRAIGADMVYQLDECTAFQDNKDYTSESMKMSLRWGKRCLDEFNRHNNGTQGVVGIVQGGVYEDLRRASAQAINEQDFFGMAVGGCLGENKRQMVDVVAMTMQHVRPDRPVHLLGIGSIDDIFANIRLGIDTFDCVTPTRHAGHGWALLKGAQGLRINLRNAQYVGDDTPLDENLKNGVSDYYSRGYLNHLIKANEPQAEQILSMHNVAVMCQLMREIRQAIREDRLDALEKEWVGNTRVHKPAMTRGWQP